MSKNDIQEEQKVQIMQKKDQDILPKILSKNEGEKRRRGRPRKIQNVPNALENSGDVRYAATRQENDINKSSSSIAYEYTNSHEVSDDWSPKDSQEGIKEANVFGEIKEVNILDKNKAHQCICSNDMSQNAYISNENIKRNMPSRGHRNVQEHQQNQQYRDKSLKQNTIQKLQHGNNNNSKRKIQPTVRIGAFSLGSLRNLNFLQRKDLLDEFAASMLDETNSVFALADIYDDAQDVMEAKAVRMFGLTNDKFISRGKIIDSCIEKAFMEKKPVLVAGIIESIEGGDGVIVYKPDNYRIRPKSAYIPRCLIQHYGLRRGQNINAYVHPPSMQSTCPFVLKIVDVLGIEPDKVSILPRFKELTPYYPTERLLLETSDGAKWDNFSMRIVDLLTPIGLGQRGLIVAPPRTGKTVLLQGIANAITNNRPDVHLIVLLIDERPEEVTDFSRQASGEVISSTFDESPDSHVHAAEIVAENARRRVEAGQHVVILLDSITRLARAYNAEQPCTGKVLSGGMEANALQLPKRFFGSARNIENGGSLTIIATALVETGSRMDDVIFEEFKGTGNMELHLDRVLSDKRLFPAINLERSGTRKEELLYHPDEIAKIYGLRRAMKGVSPSEAMEMLIGRMKKTQNNVEFLMNVNR